MAETPSAVSAGPTPQHSGAKRPRPSGVEMDVQEVMQSMDLTSDYMVLGIDEAGRGPVVGPMVYTAALISLEEHDRLIDECHVADSKMLTEHHRDAALLRLRQLKTFQSFTRVISADEIAAAMFGRHGATLNTISHDAAMALIAEATLAAAGKLCAVYVDTVGPPESYQARLAGRFPHIRVTVAKKADSKYPIVSAASIVAKTTRDRAVADLHVDVGSGYPSDPAAMRWVRGHVHRFFVHPRAYSFVRSSWGPVIKLATDPAVCHPVLFEQDLEAEEKKRGQRTSADHGKQQRLLFAKPHTRRHAVYSHLLRLRTLSGTEE
ncbi:ribonuclease H2 subunit A [Strigomonas culicis]|uniref:Ribonuclease n=1 Tax=Strigomonas culicis TaxID=28005 RepID=S9V124_9TRYP|nr:ribonuclease H2 subunit A [Strigomonas culicis]|eukprot:EPY36807.1 ribonuclease H2 subunit A [Strigomonas culicis]